MRRARFLEQERRQEAERSIKYRGTASIKLDVLHFPCEKSREPDENNVEKLRNLFRGEGGCRRLDLRNHIPAVISQPQLEAAIEASRTSAERLLEDARDNYPELDFPPGYRLECLHGRHRTPAAAQVLPLEDRRWTVDLYLEDLNQELKITLIEEYSAEKEPDDGEIYSKIREYEGYRGAGNPYFEKRWRARLAAISDHKKENLERIFRHTDYRAAFDVQLDVPGLAGGMRLSTTHTMFATRCHEENLCYLDNIRDFWTKMIFRGDREAMQKVDRATVKALELTAPGACKADFHALYGKLRSGQIFGAFDEQDREDIWSRLLSASVDSLIPSLFSFFEDLNYLKKRRRRRETIVPAMPAVPKRKKRSTKPISGKADEIVLCEFATLAYRLGYKSEPIRSLIQRSADREIARSALLKARKPDRYKYNEAISGIPYALDHERDRLSLFLDKLHNTGEEQCDKMSSFFIRRSVYFAFFGKPSRPTPRSPEEVSLLNTPISAHPEDNQVREEQERLARQEQERLEREEQQRLGRERERLAREQEQFAREEQQRLAREQERLAREEQERLAREEQERLAREQEQLAREEQERLAREEQERLAREQERLAREEQERLAREEQERQERLAREEQERLAREEQERLVQEEQERLARDEQERLVREERERLAREEQERVAREEQERLAKEEQERQEQAAREERDKLAREEQERLAKEEQERLEREEQERLAKEDQERLAKEEQERLAAEEQDHVAQEQERLIRAEQEQSAREEQERVTREEQVAENLAKQWKDRPKQKKPDKNQPDKGPKVPRSQNGVRRGFRASASTKRRERPLTQLDLKKVTNGESSEANYRFVPPSQAFNFSLEAAGDQVEVDNASHPPQPSSDSSASGKPPQLASDSREQNQAVERSAREKQGKPIMEEERLVREKQERVAHEEQEKPAGEEQEEPAIKGKERLVKNIAKQWKERLGQKMSKEKTQDQSRPKFALETLRDAESQELTQEGPSPQIIVKNER
ncbi:hypothetical protein B7494_g7918 [Chlorociboria aeruginascens]|nr:hypothetical protein B7494_g7918 [Chlorociboria aeruginascens]